MSSSGSPLVDWAKSLYDHFHSAVDAMPMPPGVKSPDVADKSQQADPQMVADATKSFVDKANQAITPTTAAKIRMRASGK